VNVIIEEVEGSDVCDKDGDGDSLFDRNADTETRLLAEPVVVRLVDAECENTLVADCNKEESDVLVIDTKGELETLAHVVVEGEEKGDFDTLADEVDEEESKED
jgi:hypothetical protein